jgi:hypothetical protein
MLLFGLFAIALITFGISIAEQNNPAQSIANAPSIMSYKNSIESDLSKNYKSFNESEDSFSESDTTLGNSQSGIIINSISGIWKDLKGGSVLIINLSFGFIQKTLFGSEFLIVFNVISGILIFITLIAVIKLVMQGEGG